MVLLNGAIDPKSDPDVASARELASVWEVVQFCTRLSPTPALFQPCTKPNRRPRFLYQRRGGWGGYRISTWGYGVISIHQLAVLGSTPVVVQTSENLWNEEDVFRQTSIVKWIIQGHFRDELVVFMVFLQCSMPWVLRQLVLTSVAFERKQQLLFAVEGHRTYQAVLQHSGPDNAAMMNDVTTRIFGDTGFYLTCKKPEKLQLDAFVMGTRMGAAAYDLVIVRVRNPPYRTLAGVENRERLTWARAQCPQRLDPYTEALVKLYGYSTGGAGCNAELVGVNLLADTDCSSTERKHSVQAKKTAETTTNKLYLPDLSAGILAREETHTGLWCGARNVDQPKLADDDDDDDDDDDEATSH